MREAWIFTHPDTWTRTEAPDWPENEDMDDWIARLGYKRHSRADNSDIVEFVGSWALYTATASDAPYAHLLLVDGALECGVFVWLPTFPDLLAYLARYGEVGQSSWDRIERDDLARAVKLMFHAWHGHDSSTFCRECDPRPVRHLAGKTGREAGEERGVLMPLVIQFHDDLSCPTIVCDWCQEPITDARLGGYFFPVVPRTEGTTVPMTFLHKGHCDDAYGAKYGAFDWWGELRDLPMYLARNLTHARRA